MFFFYCKVFILITFPYVACFVPYFIYPTCPFLLNYVYIIFYVNSCLLICVYQIFGRLFCFFLLVHTVLICVFSLLSILSCLYMTQGYFPLSNSFRVLTLPSQCQNRHAHRWNKTQQRCQSHIDLVLTLQSMSRMCFETGRFHIFTVLQIVKPFTKLTIWP